MRPGFRWALSVLCLRGRRCGRGILRAGRWDLGMHLPLLEPRGNPESPRKTGPAASASRPVEGSAPCRRVAVAGFQGTQPLCSAPSCSSSQLRAISSRSPVPGVWMANLIRSLVPSGPSPLRPAAGTQGTRPVPVPGHRLGSHQGALEEVRVWRVLEAGLSVCPPCPRPPKVQARQGPFKHFPS